MKTILSFLLFFSFLNLYSQNETGVRTGSRDRYYYNPRTHLYPLEVSIIRSIPPIDSSMPFEISLAYQVVDSLARLLTTDQAIAFINTLSWESDTMKQILKYMYKLHNYDFVRFNQYIYETKYNQFGTYKADLEDVKRYILAKYQVSSQPMKEKYLAILGSDAILRIEVLRIDSMKAIHASASRNGDTATYDFYKATYRILDTLKGNILPCSEPNINLKSEQIQSYLYPTMFIKFDHNTYWQDKDESHRNPKFQKVEPLLYDSTIKMFRFKPGDEAIIFIHNVTMMSKVDRDYLRLSLANYYSNAALPIVNGMVKDINHIWFDHELTPYEIWKKEFLRIRNDIINVESE